MFYQIILISSLLSFVEVGVDSIKDSSLSTIDTINSQVLYDNEENLAYKIFNGDTTYMSEVFEFVLKNKDVFIFDTLNGSLRGMSLSGLSMNSKYFEFIFLIDQYNEMYLSFRVKVNGVKQAFMSGDANSTIIFFKYGYYDSNYRDLIMLENESIDVLKDFEEVR
jgi:hypothetical protein